jgi:hypothetical protein
MKETIETANVTLVRDNEDGSSVYQFNFPPEALEALTRLGIMTAIQAGIGEAKKLSPEYPSNPEFTDKIKELAEEAGFAMWGKEKYKPDGAVVDWACEYDDELVRFYSLVRKQAVKDVIDSLMFQHEQVKHRHNSLKVAALAIEMEFLGVDDE